MPTPSANDHSRRDFIRASGAAITAAAALGAPRPARASNELLKIGLVGCGGRGTGAAREALLADPNTEIVALGDAFADMVDDSLSKLLKAEIAPRVKVDEAHKFSGFDAYKSVIDACDVVVLAAPPGFRPAHLRYAVEQGKHVFCEKPIAVDGPGVRHVLESARIAREKKLSLVSGLCYRYEFAKRDIIQRIHGGEIGDVVALETSYNTGGLWHKGDKPEWSRMEYQMRNWLYFDWLSGDHINEQHIHSLDKIAWAMRDAYPVKCMSSGGRAQRTDPKYGNIYDHFTTTYEFANGVKCFSRCRQWESSSTDVSDFIYGTKGTANIQEHRIDFRDGGTWQHEKRNEDNMYLNEHVALFESIRSGEARNDGEYMSHSTLMAIMARMSAYTGRSITWDQALNSELNLAPAILEWGDNVPNRPVPVPGETKLS